MTLQPTTLYRFFGVDGTLLYVGISHRLNERLSAHKREKPWHLVASITLEHHETRELALAAETTAIRTESPRWNAVLNAGPPKAPFSYRARANGLWPDAEWINGTGKYATVAYCRVTTVALHATREGAQQALRWIDQTACGGFCTRDHHLFDLDDQGYE